MTRDRLDLLLQHCADLGLNVEWADLGTHRRGEYHDDTLLILLNVHLTRAQATATLAHEIGHAVLGHRCSSHHNERVAWEFGAALAIQPREYEEAEALVGHHAGALAAELEVTPRLIHAWRRWYLRRYPAEKLRHESSLGSSRELEEDRV